VRCRIHNIFRTRPFVVLVLKASPRLVCAGCSSIRSEISVALRVIVAFTRRIRRIQRIIPHVRIQIPLIRIAHRIDLQKPSQIGVVIAGAVIIEAGLGVIAAAGIAEGIARGIAFQLDAEGGVEEVLVLSDEREPVSDFDEQP
jgi:hypothetical protein